MTIIRDVKTLFFTNTKLFSEQLMVKLNRHEKRFIITIRSYKMFRDGELGRFPIRTTHVYSVTSLAG
ncbi:MAG: hypothetical protein ACFFD2_04970 [Promethearchaeota archaeon]